MDKQWFDSHSKEEFAQWLKEAQAENNKLNVENVNLRDAASWAYGSMETVSEMLTTVISRLRKISDDNKVKPYIEAQCVMLNHLRNTLTGPQHVMAQAIAYQPWEKLMQEEVGKVEPVQSTAAKTMTVTLVPVIKPVYSDAGEIGEPWDYKAEYQALS